MYNPPAPRHDKPLHKRRASHLTASRGKKLNIVKRDGEPPRPDPKRFKALFPTRKRTKIFRAPKENIKFMYGEFWNTPLAQLRISTTVLSVMALLQIMYENAIANEFKLVPLYMFSGFPPIITIALSKQLKNTTAQKVLACSSSLCIICYALMMRYNERAQHYGGALSLLRFSFYLIPVLLPFWIAAIRLDKKRKSAA